MFHNTNFGDYGKGIECDIDGYVPEMGDEEWQFVVDHGVNRVRDERGELTEYGEWWVDEGFPAWRDRAIEQTKQAEYYLHRARQYGE